METHSDPLRLDKNLGQLSILLRGTGVGYIIFDPLSDYVAADALSDQEIRPILSTFRKWAESEGVAIVGILHVNKKNDLQAVQRASGAKGWLSVPRINNLVGSDANGGKYLVTLKTNIHKAVSAAFSTEEAEISADDVTVKTVKAVWKLGGYAKAEDLLGAKKQDTKASARSESSLTYQAMRWLQDNLTPEGTPADEVYPQLSTLYGMNQHAARKVARMAGVVYGKTKTVPAKSVWAYIRPDTSALEVGFSTLYTSTRSRGSLHEEKRERLERVGMAYT